MTRHCGFARLGITGVLAGALVAAWSGAAWSDPGDPDPSFSGDGIQTTVFDGYYGIAHDVVAQPSGRMTAVGFMHPNEGIGSDFALVRYNRGGALDPTFGNGGRVLTDFHGRYDAAHAVAGTAEGKTVAVGSSSEDMAVAVYRWSGHLDPSFDGDGRLLLDLGSFDDARDVAIQDDGKIVVVGNDGADFAVLRLNPDGTLDSSFGGGAGFVRTDFAGYGDFAYAVSVQDDGKIVAAGFTVAPGTSEDFAVARYLEDGKLDPGFGAGGLVTTDFIGWEDRITGVAIQDDGRIVVAGRASAPPGGADQRSDVGLARYTADGELDPTFGSGGKVHTDFGSYFDVAEGMAIQEDGRIVVASPFYGEGGSTAAVVRYESTGALDSSFGTNGIAVTDAGVSGDDAGGLALRPDGRIVVAGPAVTGPAEFGFLALRFLSA